MLVGHLFTPLWLPLITSVVVVVLAWTVRVVGMPNLAAAAVAEVREQANLGMGVVRCIAEAGVPVGVVLILVPIPIALDMMGASKVPTLLVAVRQVVLWGVETALMALRAQPLRAAVVAAVAGMIVAQVAMVGQVVLQVVAVVAAVGALTRVAMVGQGVAVKSECGAHKMKYAVVDDVTSVVANVIELEEGATWSPPKGCSLQKAENAAPGDEWDGQRYVRPLPPSMETTDKERYAAATSDTIRLQIIAERLGFLDARQV